MDSLENIRLKDEYVFTLSGHEVEVAGFLKDIWKKIEKVVKKIALPLLGFGFFGIGPAASLLKGLNLGNLFGSGGGAVKGLSSIGKLVGNVMPLATSYLKVKTANDMMSSYGDTYSQLYSAYDPSAATLDPTSVAYQNAVAGLEQDRRSIEAELQAMGIILPEGTDISQLTSEDIKNLIIENYKQEQEAQSGSGATLLLIGGLVLAGALLLGGDESED